MAAGVRLYVRDLALRSRVEGAVRAAGMQVDASGEGLAVVDLADDACVQRYASEGFAGPAIGFYPHVQRELADRARGLGIEPLEKREFFDDTSAVLVRHASGAESGPGAS